MPSLLDGGIGTEWVEMNPLRYVPCVGERSGAFVVSSILCEEMAWLANVCIMVWECMCWDGCPCCGDCVMAVQLLLLYLFDGVGVEVWILV